MVAASAQAYGAEVTGLENPRKENALSVSENCSDASHPLNFTFYFIFSFYPVGGA